MKHDLEILIQEHQELLTLLNREIHQGVLDGFNSFFANIGFNIQKPDGFILSAMRENAGFKLKYSDMTLVSVLPAYELSIYDHSYRCITLNSLNPPQKSDRLYRFHQTEEWKKEQQIHTKGFLEGLSYGDLNIGFASKNRFYISDYGEIQNSFHNWLKGVFERFNPCCSNT